MEATAPTKQDMMEAVPITEWVRICCAYQGEQVHFFPTEAFHIATHIDLILNMEFMGMQWLRYNVSYMMQRAKRIRRGKRANPWSATYIELYVGCSTYKCKGVQKSNLGGTLFY